MKFDKLATPLAFFIVLIIWTTTPLAIKWSSVNAPLTAAFYRMGIGMLFTVTVLLITSSKLPRSPEAIRVYLFSGLAIFFNMGLFYLAAQQIPSGWIAVLFGLSPLFTGVFSSFVEPENKMSLTRLFGLMLGMAGLYMVFSAGLNVADASILGISLTLAGTLISSITSVITRQLVKPLELTGMQITTGSMIVVVPLFALAAWFSSPSPTPDLSDRAIAATLYLGLIGTGVGFTLYYYLLKRMSASRIALITLVTPISGLAVGSWFNGEPLVGEVWSGAALVCTGLLIYEFKPRLGLRKL